jgi:putative chitinase
MTPELLAQAAGIPVERAALWVEPLAAAFLYAACDTSKRKAAFIAQTGHESGGFKYVREVWGPTPAQIRYDGRKDLGNVTPGDGYFFRGRGLLQVTGRANYGRVTDRLSGMACPDFVTHPEALEQPRWAALSAADYWADRQLNRYADAGDWKRLTRAINGGYNGLADRLARTERALAALQGA